MEKNSGNCSINNLNLTSTANSTHVKGLCNMKYCQMLHQQCGTYGTELVTVSLKATLGFPITHGQLYSLSILYNTNQNLFIDLSPQQGESYLFLKSNSPQVIKLDLLAWTVVAFAHMTTVAVIESMQMFIR